MKKIRKRRVVDTRGDDINQIGQKRVLSYDKEYDYSIDELRKAAQSEAVDFTKVKDPSKRQSAVAQIVYDMGSEAGLSSNQMAAILANGFAESRLDPYGESPGKEDSHGVCSAATRSAIPDGPNHQGCEDSR